MSLIIIFAPPSLSSKINIPHYSKMALIYDMAKALIGDITPMDKVLKHKKNRREEITMEYFIKGLLRKVNSGIIGKEINNIWREYEDGETLESKFIYNMDKIKLVLQILDYKRAHGHKLDLGDLS
jgi:putative hydrolase of HD superfamily